MSTCLLVSNVSAQTESPTTQPSTEPSTLPAIASATASPTTPPAIGSATTSPTTAASASSEDAERAARMKALVAAAATRAAAATAPTFATTPAKQMRDEFAVLRSRSIFLKGRPVSFGGSNSAATRETPRRAEDSFIFNGMTDTDGEVVAFVEDLSAGKVARVRVGEQIARGKVVRIAFDRLDYESGGRVTSVEIGQTLSGQAVGLIVSTQPATSSTPLSDDPNDVLSRMRRARMEGR